MRKKLLYFSYSDRQPTDGGMARNHAFLLEMIKREAKVINHHSLKLNHRILYFIKNFFLLMSTNNSNIVILQSVLLKFIFPFALFKFQWFRLWVGFVLNYVSKKNTLYIEINDLIYEQSIDLGFKVNLVALEYQKFIFVQKRIQFIFASKSMGDYAIQYYNVNPDSIQTIINGAPRLDKSIFYKLKFNDVQRTKYIYAGTLNKGREIYNLIEVFSKCNNIDLVLIGIEGEWINETKYKNIHYLGKFDEKTALKITSMCDIGIIPYSEKKKYYNICYPTKNSFYIAAGLPILCTPLQETIRVFKEYPEIVFFVPFDSWYEFVNNTSHADILKAKNHVETIKHNFLWSHLLSKLRIN